MHLKAVAVKTPTKQPYDFMEMDLHCYI